MIKPLMIAVLLAPLASALADNPSAFPLWPDKVPGALGTEAKDIPTLTPFLPDPATATGAAMVVCPGGGYANLAAHEGEGYAHWLNDNGIAAYVLKSRLGSGGYRHPAMLEDAARALRTVRANAAAWKLDPKRIGIIGSSAGGHLAATLLTHFDAGKPADDDPVERQSSRPDLGVLCYPVITMGPNTHQGSRKNLLGDAPSPEVVDLLSAEKQVTRETPPCFVWTTQEDRTVKMENSLDFAAALQRNHVPMELHIYQKGAHGMGLGGKDKDPHDAASLHPWTRDCIHWLKEQNFAK